jgi:prepilin-type N-terminal cleavage/methylation domain-containing protein
MKTPVTPTTRAGFTLPELLTTITIISLLCGIAIASYSGLHNTARESVAHDNVASLNRALLHFNQSNWDIVLDAIDDSVADELAVLRALQWRNPDDEKATPGSPYVSLQFDATTSSSEDDYRIRWNGHTFEVLAPGTSGSGLKTGVLQTESNSTFAYPSGYTLPAAGQHE